MLTVAVWILTLAVAAGTLLALWHLRASDTTARPPLIAGIAHGVTGAVGLGFLLVTVSGPPRGVATGVASFGTTSALLFAAALASGIIVLRLRQKAVVIAVHAGIAITGYVLLLAWDALG